MCTDSLLSISDNDLVKSTANNIFYN